MKEWRITSDDEAHIISILGPDGVLHTFGGFAMFAGDGFEGATLIAAEGSASDAAMAFARGYSMPAMSAFYQSAALHFLNVLDPHAFEHEGNPGEILERWEREDKEPVGNA